MIRRQGREAALQTLYQLDLSESDWQDTLVHLAEEFALPQEAVTFARELVTGVLSCRSQLDEEIEQRSEGWPVRRMGVVDRNILRLGAFELLHREDIPPAVAVNEAVELAKRYGDKDSSRFINGILGRMLKELKKDERSLSRH
ncbi:MAG: transcription antitermination factor NusB [Bacillota bacterium]